MPADTVESACNQIGTALRRHAAIALLQQESVDLALSLPAGCDEALKAQALGCALAQPGWLFKDLLVPLISLEMAMAAAEERQVADSMREV